MDAPRERSLLERLLAAAGLAMLAVLVVVPVVLAEEPLRYNCPDGFVWIRMSGTGCVQETVPTNGKIGYDGHALCIDPYVGIYETRGTTDGKGVPGNPATSFTYLLECVTPEEAVQRQVAGGGGDLTSLLAGTPTELPDAEDLVVIGLTGTGGILLAASRFRRPTKPPAASSTGSPSRPLPSTSAPPGTSSPALEPLPTDPEEVRRKLDELAAVDATLASLADRIRAAADAGQLSGQDWVTFLGMLADAVALIPIPPVQLAAGGVSIGASLSLAVSDAAGWDERAIHRDMRRRLDDIARMRGIIMADREILEQRREAPDPPPEQVPGRIDLDPTTMPDQMLREERERSQARVDQAELARVKRSAEVTRLMHERWRAEDRVRDLRRVLDAYDAARDSDLREGVSDATTGADLLAGVDGFVEQWGESAALALRDTSRRLMRESFDTADFWEQANAARGAGELAEQAGRASRWASYAGAGAAAATGYQWLQDFSAEQQRVVIERVLEQHVHDAAELAQQKLRAEQEEQQLWAECRDAVRHRDAIWAEAEGRAKAQGHVLWTR
jgi:hypothetical protein